MNNVKKFVAQWSGRGYEKGETHSFWLSFLRDVSGVSEPEKFISFEVPVKLKHTSFIDAFLPDTKVIIEQKSLSKDLTQEKSQSDGETLMPYEQAQRYITGLPLSSRVSRLQKKIGRQRKRNLRGHRLRIISSDNEIILKGNPCWFPAIEIKSNNWTLKENAVPVFLEVWTKDADQQCSLTEFYNASDIFGKESFQQKKQCTLKNF